MATKSSNEDDTDRAKPEVLRGSCDHCRTIKRHCPGGDPCPRCARGSFACTYSPRRKIGRPTKRAGADASSQQPQGSQGKPMEREQGLKKRKQDLKQRQNTARGGEISRWNQTCRSFGFRASSSTGLAGMPESQYVSCFLEHCAPMCGFVNEVTVRDGLVRVFFDRWNDDDITVGSSSSPSPSPPSADARRESAAVECTLFSVMAIGALVLGAPATVVSRYMKTAGGTLAKFAGWKEQPAVTALILFGLANTLLPAPHDGPGHEQEQLHRSSMDDAQAIHGELHANAKDPLVNAFLTYRATCEHLVSLLLTAAGSVDPVNTSAWQAGSRARTPRIQAAHPAYVTTDTTTLISSMVGPTGTSRTGWLNVHDFIQAGFNRLVKEHAGALVLTIVAGHLIAAKGRVGTTEGMLPVAELILSLFTQCPGLLRYYTRHNADMALATFKRCDQRGSYDALRGLVFTATGREIATFDDFGVGVATCDSKLCGLASDMILGVPVSPFLSGAAEGARGTEGLPQDDQQQQQQNNQWSIVSPPHVALESGMGLGVVARAGVPAAGARPPYSSTGASELGLGGEQPGEGRRWAGQVNQLAVGVGPASGTVFEGQAESGGKGGGIGSMAGLTSLVSHQSDDGRDRQSTPFFAFSGGGVGTGAGPSLTEAAVRQQQQQQCQSWQEQQREPGRRGIPAVGGPCLAPGDNRQQLVPSIDSNDGGGTGYPLQDPWQGKPPLTEYGGGAQSPSSYGGGGGGGDVGGDEDGGTAQCYDLADLLLDDTLL